MRKLALRCKLRDVRARAHDRMLHGGGRGDV